MCCKSIKTCGNENHQIQDGGNLWQEERGMELGRAPRDLLLCHSVLFKNRNWSQFLQNVRIQQSWDAGILFTILFCLQVTWVSSSSVTNSPCDLGQVTPLFGSWVPHLWNERFGPNHLMSLLRLKGLMEAWG